MFERLARFVLRHRALTAATLIGLVLVTLGGAVKMQADFSAVAFYGSGDAEVAHLLDFKERWGADDSVVLILLEAPDGEDVVTPARLAAVVELTDLLERHPDVTSVASITATPRLVGDAPGLIDLQSVGQSIPATDDPDDPAWQAWRTRLLDHPVAVPMLLSADGAATALAVELDVDADDIASLRPTVQRVRADVAAFDGRASMDLITAGIPAVRTDFFEMIFEDQVRAVALISITVSLLLLLLFRRPHGLLVPGAAAVVPTVMVFGLMGWTGETIGILNQSYFTLLPVIAIADSIHMVSRFHEEARRLAPPGQRLSDEQRRTAIRRAVGRIGLACLLTSTTTAVGFASLQMADMPILRGYGLYAAVGIGFAYGTVLLILPLMLSWSRGAVPEATREGNFTAADRLLLACGRFSVRRAPLVFAVTALVIGLSIWFGTKVVVDNTLTGLLDAGHPTTIANRVADDRLGGILALEIDLVGPPDAMKDPAVLQALVDLDEWALAQDPYRTSSGPHRFASAFNQAVRGDHSIPRTRNEIAQLYLLGEGAGLTEVIDLDDYCCGRAMIRIKDGGGIVTEERCEAVKTQLAERFDGLPVTARLTGTPYVAYRGINRVTSDLRDSLALAFVIVTLTILLLFRSPRVAGLALVPNALPLLVGYGTMGAMGWLLDPTPAVVFTVALGIAVDDTIHMVARWQEERRAGRRNGEAIEEAVLHTGRAVTVTTIVLIGGFGVNVLSSFPTMRIMGMLGATVVAVAWVADLFLLPALLSRFGGEGPPVSAADAAAG